MGKNEGFTVEEFKRMVDFLMASRHLKKQEIAKNLHLSVGHFSKIYNDAEPLTYTVFLKLKNLYEGQKDVPNSPIVSEVGTGIYLGQILEKLNNLESRVMGIEESLKKKLTTMEESIAGLRILILDLQKRKAG